MFAGEETQALDNLDRVLERFNNGEFDLILVGRGMLADPAWSQRVRAGESLAPFDKSALTRLA
jgi:2,4-dienoyl-CoA reductase-like NADH-dependent reductase (Old Yellow Enzyme family)